MYAHKGIIAPIIIGCRVATPKSIEFRSKLGLDQSKIILTKKQSVFSNKCISRRKYAYSIQCPRL